MHPSQVVALIAWAGIAAADETAVFQTMLHQPLVSCSIVGAILGDAMTGVWVGVALQAVWSGLLPLGATSYPDVPVGAVVGAAAAVLAARAGSPAPAALAFGVGCGLLTGVLGSGSVRALRRAQVRLGAVADAAADRGQAGRIVLLNASGAVGAFLRGAVLGGVGIGAAAILARAYSGAAAGLLARTSVAPVIGVGVGALAATFAGGVRRRYAVFLLSAAAAFLLNWKIL